MKYFDDVKIRLTIRGICLFEQMTNKSFFELNDDDLIPFMYCTIVSSNEFNYTYETFAEMCNNQKVATFLSKEYEKLFTIISQFNTSEQPQEDEQPQDSGETQNPKMTELCSTLIVNVGLDPEYVYDKMQLWEINLYMEKYEAKEKARLEEQRLWTYLTLAPNLDSKKKVKPEDILPFPWEKQTKKQNAEKDLKDKESLIRNILGAPIVATSAEKQTLE